MEVARAVNRSLEPSEVAQAGLQACLRSLRLDAGALWLPGDEGLALAYSTGLSWEQDRALRRSRRSERLVERATQAIFPITAGWIGAALFCSSPSAGGHRAMEPTQAAHDDYYARTQKELEGLVWSHPSIEHSWYKNAEGRIHILSPWRLVDYWAWTREPDLRDFAFSR